MFCRPLTCAALASSRTACAAAASAADSCSRAAASWLANLVASSRACVSWLVSWLWLVMVGW